MEYCQLHVYAFERLESGHWCTDEVKVFAGGEKAADCRVTENEAGKQTDGEIRNSVRTVNNKNFVSVNFVSVNVNVNIINVSFNGM